MALTVCSLLWFNMNWKIWLNIFNPFFQMLKCVNLCGMTQNKTPENQMSISQQCTNIILSHGLNAIYAPSIFQHFWQNAKKAKKHNKDACILDACIMNMKIPRFLLIFLKYTSYFHEYTSFSIVAVQFSLTWGHPVYF